MRLPSGLKFWRVDEVIECLPFGADRGHIETALLTAMPNAYESGSPSETPPEPDAEPQYKLRAIWSKLPADVQAAISNAFQKETRDEN